MDPGCLESTDESPDRGIPRKVVTLRDVAQHAGVGTMTVSRALHKPEMVSDQLRAKILASVKELGYIRNRFAGGLASGTARIVPVIIPTLRHPVYIPFLEGVYSVLSPLGYQVILGTTEYLLDVEEHLVEAFLGSFPDALIVSGVDHSMKTKELLEKSGLPIVEAMDLADHPIGINVGFSHYKVGVAIAEFFQQKGYKRIAYAGTLTEIDLRSVKRILGFQQTLKDFGLPHYFIQRSNEPFSIGLGSKLLGELLEQHPDIQAIFFANDDLAAGAIFECQRRGIRVPDQLAIMGFNDQDIAESMVPSITSIATPRRQIGELAAQLLVRGLDGRPLKERRTDVGFKIIERETTRADA
jgi:LacI family transcriptional regulator, gluconate utilization system Gnt-I transcriptional repressor